MQQAFDMLSLIFGIFKEEYTFYITYLADNCNEKINGTILLTAGMFVSQTIQAQQTEQSTTKAIKVPEAVLAAFEIDKERGESIYGLIFGEPTWTFH